jgi:hypothetical protein
MVAASPASTPEFGDGATSSREHAVARTTSNEVKNFHRVSPLRDFDSTSTSF